MKYCKKCNKEKDSSEFYNCNTRKDGLQIYCKECISKNVKLNYKKNKDRLIKKQRGYNIFNKYGITESEYNKMLSQQSNKCAICGSSEIKSKGGKNSLDNLQFLTWFENRCKNNMTQKEWDKLKQNINNYFI